MPARRILSLWFPRLAAERVLRLERGLITVPLAVVTDQGNMQVLGSLSAEAQAAGLYPGQPLRDARAMCPDLISRPASPQAEADFLTTLRRWTGKFTPWVGEEPPASLVLDMTGCAHLFGGEEALVAEVAQDCTDLGLTVRTGLADTVGTAWALARFAGQGGEATRSGDAIDQEARATRSRAARGKRRHWTRGGAAPQIASTPAPKARIAPVGGARAAIAPLPVAALRLPAETVEGLNRLGLRRIGDILGTPRAGLARRFGTLLVRRIDQALGMEPEPVSPARPPLHFAVRMGLPEPIGRDEDILAGLDRLLPALADKLRSKGRGARRVRLELGRVDHTLQVIEIGLARPSADPGRICPLLAMRLDDIDPGFGIDQMRLVAPVHEAAAPRQKGPASGNDSTALADLMGRIGARLGLEALTRLHPAESHMPEKATITMAAAFSDPALGWPSAPIHGRPLVIWPSEPVATPGGGALPLQFRWRGRTHRMTSARGPERISPEWWLDEPEWRTGQRDYWQITTDRGEWLWLYFAHGAALSAGWFCQGSFQ